MLKLILLNISITLTTISGLLFSLSSLPPDKIPIEPVFGAINTVTSATGTFYSYLKFKDITVKPAIIILNPCIKIPDIYGGGFTYLTTYRGVATYSSVSCE